MAISAAYAFYKEIRFEIIMAVNYLEVEGLGAAYRFGKVLVNA